MTNSENAVIARMGLSAQNVTEKMDWVYTLSAENQLLITIYSICLC